MPRTIRFHLDENCAKAISGGLTRLGIDVTTTPKMGLMGATDEQQAAHCLAERRVLFTQDPGFPSARCRGRRARGDRILRQGREVHRRDHPAARPNLGDLRARRNGR